ncbi:hypothetical protein SODALDRAFT_326458 [Sodiomyces alkalinus F11]|uniref:Uncharacterized protein n=1 Tax=Sodiomyces alkalinus (strain CBS 110278 / VKM F-3762 / F11) TaxID=1314773 RepID=A0A3N2Q674_SODAK|nr:hypothetical protein SODALDRAFT_326458 [Sodiomyces alkalinus F11]ROT42274.1 hypothetical protein SODALDRAFT_326458 [Sodiomyces alkalinus F11]
MSLRASRTSRTNRNRPKKSEFSKDARAHLICYNPELQAAASMYISGFLGRMSTAETHSLPTHQGRARHSYHHPNPKVYPSPAAPVRTFAKAPSHWKKGLPGSGGNMALVPDDYSRSAYTVSAKARMEPLRLGLRHLVQQYQETREVCNQLKTEFDEQVSNIKAYCGMGTLDRLWKEKNRSNRESGQGLDAKLCAVQFCLDNFENHLFRVSIPRQANEQVIRIQESGRRVVGLMRQTRRSRVSLHRLVAELSQGEVEADPDSEENKVLFKGQDGSGDGCEHHLDEDQSANAGDDIQ